MRYVELQVVRTVSVTLVLLPSGAAPFPSALPEKCVPTLLYATFDSVAAGFSGVAGWPLTIGASVLDDCGHPMNSGSVVASFSNGDSPLMLRSKKDGSWFGTWQPKSGLDHVVISLHAVEDSNALFGTAVTSGSISSAAEVPIVASDGVVSAASFSRGEALAPGSFISILGKRLANRAVTASAIPYPTTLGETQVLLGGRKLPLQFSSDGQVNAIIPYNVPINTMQPLIVVNGSTISQPESVTITAAQPSVFTLRQNGKGAGVIYGVRSNRSPFLITASDPALAGDILLIYATGLGSVSTVIAAGDGAVGVNRTQNPVGVTIGGRDAEVLFSGLAPGLPGVYQLNVRVPDGLEASEEAVIAISSTGQKSPPVTIAVR